MKLNSTEKYLIFKRRAWSRDKTVVFHADMYKLRKNRLPVPHKYRDIDLGVISIGEIAFILRWRADMTTRGLGNEVGVSHQTITNWEYDRKGGVIRQLKYLKKYLTQSELIFVRNSYGMDL